jgi:hypothetical protein
VDTEWLLSTLFDASLLSLEPPKMAALFLVYQNDPTPDPVIALETIS